MYMSYTGSSPSFCIFVRLGGTSRQSAVFFVKQMPLKPLVQDP